MDDRFVKRDSLFAAPREFGAAPVRAPGGELDQRLPGGLVDRSDELPRSPIRHVHLFRGSRNAAMLIDQPQQLVAAGTQHSFAVAFDPQPNLEFASRQAREHDESDRFDRNVTSTAEMQTKNV